MMPSVAGATPLEQRAPRGGVAGRGGAELVGRDLDFRESLHLSLWLRCRAAAERSQSPGWAWLYFRPRAGMAELVDAADSKSVALIRRVGSIPSPGTTQSMNFCSNCGTRVVLKVPEGDFLPRHVCENCGTIHYQNPKIVVGSVPEYEGPHPDLQARHRAAAGLLDDLRRVHGKRRDAGGRRRARGAGGSADRRGDRQPAAGRQRHARAPGARLLPLPHAHARISASRTRAWK